jgi:predicted nucleotidyltransferase
MTGARVEDFPAVEQTLQTLLNRAREILGDQFVGMYVYGSLSSGDFDEASSDIDFLVVTKSELSAAQLSLLARMHAEIKASGAPFTNVLEGSYIPVGAMRRYDPANADHPSIGVDSGFGVREHGWNWVLERDNILRSGQLQTAVRHVLTEYWARIGKPDWLQQAAYQAFAILTMCRALYTLDTGEQATKSQAARWAGDALGPPWRNTSDGRWSTDTTSHRTTRPRPTSSSTTSSSLPGTGDPGPPVRSPRPATARAARRGRNAVKGA